jgi:carbon storage regulator
MLVLSRKPNEKIIIGDNVEVVVLEVKGRQVRIGVAAPRDIPVHREEVLKRIKEGQVQKEKEDRDEE